MCNKNFFRLHTSISLPLFFLLFLSLFFSYSKIFIIRFRCFLCPLPTLNRNKLPRTVRIVWIYCAKCISGPCVMCIPPMTVILVFSLRLDNNLKKSVSIRPVVRPTLTPNRIIAHSTQVKEQRECSLHSYVALLYLLADRVDTVRSKIISTFMWHEILRFSYHWGESTHLRLMRVCAALFILRSFYFFCFLPWYVRKEIKIGWGFHK